MADLLARLPRAAAGGVAEAAEVLRHGDPDGLFQIGSVTKVFTAVLLATYVVEGALELEQPLASVLPEVAGQPVGTVTLASLSTHTSGLPRLPAGMWRRGLTRHPDPYADLDHERLLAALAETPLRRHRRPRYSNLGVGLLGHALSRWAGVGYDELVRERVCVPLGMHATGCHPEVESPGHHRNGRPYDGVWHFDALAGAGALWSTVADLQRFLAAQLDRPEGALGEAIRLTHQVRVPGRRLDHCLGWVRLHGRDDGALLWHDGGTAGYRSFVGLQDDAAVVVLAASDRSVDGVGMKALATVRRP